MGERQGEKAELGGEGEGTMRLLFSMSLAAPPNTHPPKQAEALLQRRLICIADLSQLLFASVANQRWFK